MELPAGLPDFSCHSKPKWENTKPPKNYTSKSAIPRRFKEYQNSFLVRKYTNRQPGVA
jgi:hypothetical protein